jgi:hypothetical protein
MNLQHERLRLLCETLNLPFIAQGYAVTGNPPAFFPAPACCGELLPGDIHKGAARDGQKRKGASAGAWG